MEGGPKVKTILFYDCFCGISGDMNLGAMIDIGVDPQYLTSELNKLHLPEFELEIKKDIKNGISGTNVNVHVTSAHHNHDHPRQEHHHRGLNEINTIIDTSDLSNHVKTISKKMFRRLAETEARIHGTTPDKIHFHEVGAVDSIVDIIGSAICIEYLKPDEIISSPVQVGGGFVDSAHGHFPVPAPATTDLLRGIPLKTGLVESETTTPTGALILATFADTFTSQTDFSPKKIGYGIGNKSFETVPNVLRVYWGEKEENAEYETDIQTVIECNIDDMNSELYEPLMQKLFDKDAKDVFLTPIVMKKSRPAVTLQILCNTADTDMLIDVVFRNSTTFGVRSYQVRKTMLRRSFETIETSYGKIKVKYGYAGEKRIKGKPEYADCLQAAENNNVTVKEIYDFVMGKIERE